MVSLIWWLVIRMVNQPPQAPSVGWFFKMNHVFFNVFFRDGKNGLSALQNQLLSCLKLTDSSCPFAPLLHPKLTRGKLGVKSLSLDGGFWSVKPDIMDKKSWGVSQFRKQKIQRNVSIHWLNNCAFMEGCGLFILTSWTLQSENSFRNKWLESI